ncbi:MAG: DNA polymerase III subunit delta [Phocaeicola sp.]|uniref:DNA polymerase III subunit delta n=1 Tax=Phocaeicola TaxID=909656 RepID=UPI00234E6EB2|nr:DNA polymerase III subunit delta [Phocaeicola oris]MCE2616537.1 DNA polymerase III subunit delta [Phocaeicola oris]
MAKEQNYLDILADLQKKQFKPIYYLMGEEPYFIDVIANYIENNVLTEAEKGFNLTVVYGTDTDISDIVNTAKRYPMMSDYQVVIVREAQSVKSIDELVYYLRKPLTSTILVFCHKHGVLDRRKKLAAEIQKIGVLFDSKRLRDYQLPQFIENYLKQKSIDIDSKASAMMAEYVGADLNRMVSELDKLIITLPKGQNRITPTQIELNIGISKDFNNFELLDAIINKNVVKANRIVKYFAENPKSNPLVMTLSTLFGFFSNLMLVYYSPVQTEQGIAAHLGLRLSWQARDYLKAKSKYTGTEVLQIIDEIRYCDARSKGVENSSVSDGELLRELIYKILH